MLILRKIRNITKLCKRSETFGNTKMGDVYCESERRAKRYYG
ncbi:hypothetical protein [uncultured Clostridium sp.]|jgi:hypothetical protein|nr:hypothetical protein [uncultured Clostridium sp.]